MSGGDNSESSAAGTRSSVPMAPRQRNLRWCAALMTACALTYDVCSTHTRMFQAA
jgi:hypothetical protein